MRILTIIPLLTFLSISFNALGFKTFQKQEKNDSLIIKIRKILLQSKYYCCLIEESRGIEIKSKIDISGDSIPELLVFVGCGGASTECLALIQIENGEPVLALFKQKDGKVTTAFFLEGASVKHRETIKMISAKNAIYQTASEWDETKNSFTLTVTAYQWNEKTKTFDYNQNLSNEIFSELRY